MSVRAELVRLGLRCFLKRRSGLERWRRDCSGAAAFIPGPPAGTKIATYDIGRVRAHRVTTPLSSSDRHVLYLHGGGYTAGSWTCYRHLAWHIAWAARASVLAIDYRLAPEHPFPAALEDAVSAYDWLTADGANPRQLAVVGDSAGGGLVFGMLLKLRDERHPLPAAAVALSPWTDLALTGPSLQTNARADPMLNPEHLPKQTEYYLAGADPRTPYASPLYGDLTAFPPTLIQVGSDEILLDDAVRMADRLRVAGCDVKLEVWRRMPHVWHLFVPALPEARRGIKRVAAFVQDKF